jgi:hypothetical protein
MGFPRHIRARFEEYPKPPKEILEWTLTVSRLQSTPSECMGAGVYLDRDNRVIALGINVESIPCGPSRKIFERDREHGRGDYEAQSVQTFIGREGMAYSNLPNALTKDERNVCVTSAWRSVARL